MKKIALLITGVILCSMCNAQMPVFGADSMRKVYQAKADELLVGDSSLYKLFRIDLYGIEIYSRNDGKIPETKAVEYTVRWPELQMYKDIIRTEERAVSMQIMLGKGARSFSPALQKQYDKGIPPRDKKFRTPMKPLAGWKIALDPGHVANDTALGHIEQKFISMNVPVSYNNQTDSVPVAFAEGQLTWQTANMLAYRLRNAGAEVIFTRNGPGMTAFGKTFAQWKREDYPRTLDSLLKVDPANQNLKDLKSGRMKEDRSIFRFVFRDAELRKRSEIINAFNPDLTVVIHYNVDETNAPWSKPSTRNYCMLFVPGSFEAGELSTPEDRFDFLRLLLLDDIEQSIAVSDLVAQQFKTKLDVPLAGPSDATYLSTSCRKAFKQGVFCRNLSMTRLVHGPIVYGETLYQDNRYEARILSDMSIADMASQQTTSKRVMQVTEAYYEGILQWSYTQ
jgi:N-acetylmuramoyl-L-alanine amidase